MLDPSIRQEGQLLVSSSRYDLEGCYKNPVQLETPRRCCTTKRWPQFKKPRVSLAPLLSLVSNSGKKTRYPPPPGWEEGFGRGEETKALATSSQEQV